MIKTFRSFYAENSVIELFNSAITNEKSTTMTGRVIYPNASNIS